MGTVLKLRVSTPLDNMAAAAAPSRFRRGGFAALGLALALALTTGPALAATAASATPAKVVKTTAADALAAEQASIGPSLALTVGKSTLLRLPGTIERISVGNPAVADVTLVGPKELYLLGKTFGSTNVILWHKGGRVVIVDVSVNVDSAALLERLQQLLPDEKGIQVLTAADAIVLKGTVSSSVRAEQAVTIADAYVRAAGTPVQSGDAGAGKAGAAGGAAAGGSRQGGGGGGAAQSRVVNMLQVTQPQQVMLEVKVAEVSKTLLDELGISISGRRGSGHWTYGILSDLLTGGAGSLSATRRSTQILLDAEKKDGLIKILAEPNIVAISGQEASFLAGGKIFIPVARRSDTGGTEITLEEKEFGVGVKFTPTVLDGGRINLKVSPEVSELNQSGSPFTSVNNVTAILPSFTTRRAQTTVQMMDGQTFAIAGLIKSNVSETMRRMPILGDIPILGMLFRSAEFNADRTELVFLITPHLVKPQTGDVPPLPTDSFVPPSRGELFFEGKLEGSGRDDVPADRQPRPAAGTPPVAAPQAPARGGFEVK